MANVDVLNWNKKSVGKIDLDPEIFEVPVKPELLHTVVRWQLASRRRGTHKSKTRAEVSGGGKKPFKQKGTGNARQGSTRSPLMPGGGITFGPVPRDYSYVLPKKVKQSALRVALSHLHSQGRLFIVEDMAAKGKTKELAKQLQDFGLNQAVLMDVKTDAIFKRASRNLPKFKYYSVDGLNVYDLLKMDTLVLTKSSIEAVTHKCGKR